MASSIVLAGMLELAAALDCSPDTSVRPWSSTHQAITATASDAPTATTRDSVADVAILANTASVWAAVPLPVVWRTSRVQPSVDVVGVRFPSMDIPTTRRSPAATPVSASLVELTVTVLAVVV